MSVEAIIFGLVGLLLILILGWLKLDVRSVGEQVNSVDNHLRALNNHVGELGEGVARIEGKLDEHLRQHQ